MFNLKSYICVFRLTVDRGGIFASWFLNYVYGMCLSPVVLFIMMVGHKYFAVNE